MNRHPRLEVVHSDAGWFARIRAANGRKVWQTEVYARRRGAVRAIELAIAALGFSVTSTDEAGPVLTFDERDERTEAGR